MRQWQKTAIVTLMATLMASACGRQNAPGSEPLNGQSGRAQPPAPEPGSFEAAAIGELRAIVSGEIAFAVSCANNGYAQQFDDLVKPAPRSTMGYLLPGLTNGGVKRGYVFTLGPGAGAVTVTRAADTCNGAARDALSSFFAEAHPATVGMLTRRSFAVDERGIIFVNENGRPIAPGMAGAQELK